MILKERVMRFMTGRYGFDELSRVYLFVVIALFIVSMFTKNNIFYVMALALMVYTYFRAFSKNVSNRQEENQKFLNFRYNATVKWNAKKKQFAQRREYHFFKCPQCKQTVRVPRGHGRICITCPKCNAEFIKKS